jgi:hypothetical protein
MHKGQIQVHSNDDPSQGQTGTAFTINFNKRISDLKNTLIK